MSLALLGTVLAQLYWIQNSVKSREVAFSRDVYQVLEKVARTVENNELMHFYVKYSGLTRDNRYASEADFKGLIYEQIDTLKNEKFTYARTILEQKYKVPTDMMVEDSLTLSRTFSKKDVIVTKTIKSEDGSQNVPIDEKISTYEELTSLDKELFKDLYYENSKRIPVHMRVRPNDIERQMSIQFQNKGIDIPFKFALYDRGMLTSVKSGFFQIDKGTSYHVPLFVDSKGESDYHLYVNFPEERRFIFSGIAKYLALSILFILTIIGVFAATLWQLKKQKQISAIKTDFINNMTHEFKTPIATINLALDSIKNPKILGDQEKVLNYVKMIRQENKRMHAQVETVLRISKLENKQLKIDKEVIDLHEILEDAISHVQLLIDDRKGKLKVALEAPQSEVHGNAFHLTNVFINILDNAIKYSPETLEIYIKTENTANAILTHITDKGAGMSKQAQKHIFDDFYREESGNVHNVKGHGLGLSYVKKIVELHHGKIIADSEKGKGSTFTVKLEVV